MKAGGRQADETTELPTQISDEPKIYGTLNWILEILTNLLVKRDVK